MIHRSNFKIEIENGKYNTLVHNLFKQTIRSIRRLYMEHHLYSIVGVCGFGGWRIASYALHILDCFGLNLLFLEFKNSIEVF